MIVQTAGNNTVPVTRTVNIVANPTLTINVTTFDSGTYIFTIMVQNLTPSDQVSITAGTPFGPVNLQKVANNKTLINSL